MIRKEEREKEANERVSCYGFQQAREEYYTHFIEGAEWADETLLKKVCDFLSNVDIWKYTSSLTSGVFYMNFRRDEFINDLKKFCNNIQENTLDYENLVG
jgi:hypothetical protein